jgi:hypothetical protein
MSEGGRTTNATAVNSANLRLLTDVSGRRASPLHGHYRINSRDAGGRKVDRALVPQFVSYLSGPSRREGMADYSGVRADLVTAVIVC